MFYNFISYITFLFKSWNNLIPILLHCLNYISLFCLFMVVLLYSLFTKKAHRSSMKIYKIFYRCTLIIYRYRFFQIFQAVNYVQTPLMINYNILFRHIFHLFLFEQSNLIILWTTKQAITPNRVIYIIYHYTLIALIAQSLSPILLTFLAVEYMCDAIKDLLFLFYGNIFTKHIYSYIKPYCSFILLLCFVTSFILGNHIILNEWAFFFIVIMIRGIYPLSILTFI